MYYLDNHISDIATLCSQHNVRHLFAFGSVLTDDFKQTSDVDLMVDFLPVGVTEYADNYYSLKFALEKILNRTVDLLEEQALKNPYLLKSINNKKRLIYGN
ncbi:nucleotidyltransferase family protein [Sediminibacterium ginsengisoli]|uniref:Polymerase beta nucleotidyltransferase domain-containing protein n=1 Tax=Sediminibacterium ginsengisoli TaxID=413434 RepID=A0A1T4MEC1_9BACT|nr:nucleotidyltransferase domain-containing protein [Sediminibacterium ginsengisoli]SJZ65379.1 hypothetical protein SAMN04488132_103351 [Sediminibacterium ginsengisoli]